MYQLKQRYSISQILIYRDVTESGFNGSILIVNDSSVDSFPADTYADCGGAYNEY